MHRILKIVTGVVLCTVVFNASAAVNGDGPITFKWSDAEPIVGRNFAKFKKAELVKLQSGAVLEITGLYSSAEQQAAGNPVPNLGIVRATKTAALLAPSIQSNRIKLSSALVSDDGFTEVTKKMAPFAAVSFADVPIISARAKNAFSDKPIPILFPINKVIRHSNPCVSGYLKKVAAFLKTSDRRAMLVGLTDRRGANEMNLRLATQRAESIRDELIMLGVPAKQIDISTKSAPDPTSRDDSINGRQLNRRVEIFII
jgi:outer membrane protein OmpA-like peptidoglycan-associated protein